MDLIWPDIFGNNMSKVIALFFKTEEVMRIQLKIYLSKFLVKALTVVLIYQVIKSSFWRKDDFLA